MNLSGRKYANFLVCPRKPKICACEAEGHRLAENYDIGCVKFAATQYATCTALKHASVNPVHGQFICATPNCEIKREDEETTYMCFQ